MIPDVLVVEYYVIVPSSPELAILYGLHLKIIVFPRIAHGIARWSCSQIFNLWSVQPLAILDLKVSGP
jgi:hypothetical protein